MTLPNGHLSQEHEVVGETAADPSTNDGWIASALRPRLFWVKDIPATIREWTPNKDVWELYNLEEDWSHANDLAAKYRRSWRN